MTYGKQIVVLDRGLVFVGDVTVDGDFYIIPNALRVRRWDTSKGLGELAASGPLPSTVLDAAGTVRAHKRAIFAKLSCEAAKWTTR